VQEFFIDPSKYHQLCRYYAKQITPFEKIINKFKKRMKESFLLSELSFNQLLLFNSHVKENNSEIEHDKDSHSMNEKSHCKDDIIDKDTALVEKKNLKGEKIVSETGIKKTRKDILFFQTLNKCINDNNSKIETKLWVDKKIKFKISNDIKKIYDVNKINLDKFSVHWKNFDNKIEPEIIGNLLIANKFEIDETIKNSIKYDGDDDDNMMVVYDGISVNDSIVKVDINNKYSLIIFSEKKNFDKKWIYDQLKTLEIKKTLVIIPRININNAIDIKRISLLKDKIKEINDVTQTSNIFSLISLKLSEDKNNKTKINISIYKKVYKKNSFNFVILHQPSQQLVMYGWNSRASP
jgi:hypothetical protein